MTAKKDEAPVDEPVTQSGVRVSDVDSDTNDISLTVDTEKAEDGRTVSSRTATLVVNGKKTVLSADEIGALSSLAQHAFLETH